MMDDIIGMLPVRTATDALRGIARFELGGEEAILPVLVIDDNDRWLADIDGQLAGLLDGVSAAGDDAGQIIALLGGQTPALLGLLKGYDKLGLLPSVEEIRRTARPHEVLLAVLAIWRAANPLVDIALVGLATSGRSFGPTSSPPPPGTDSPESSDAASPPSSSSGSSTPPASDSTTSMRSGSKRSARGRSSPTTGGPTAAGDPRRHTARSGSPARSLKAL